MRVDNLVAIVSLAALLLYFWTSTQVARMRLRHRILTPAMTGHLDVERALRVQGNTLEWLPLFLPSLWLFAWYFYAISYMKDPKSRGPGFGIQALATGALLLGSLGKAIYLAVAGG